MHFIIPLTLLSTALILHPAVAVVLPRELAPRDCPNQDYDPNGIVCDSSAGS